MTSVTIPSSVTSIGTDAFKGCTSLPVENNLRYADTYLVEAVDKTQIEYTIKEGTLFIGSNAFSHCKNITTFTIPNGVTSIGSGVFDGCSNLATVNIPDGVTSISNSAFADCSKLTSITIPNSVTSIDFAAFYRCYGLTSVSIPSSVTKIDGTAFDYCSGLTSITIPSSVTSIGLSAFSGCTSLPVENGLRYADTYLVEAVDKEQSVFTIKDGTRFISSTAFNDCENITSITFPNSVTEIEEVAFYCLNCDIFLHGILNSYKYVFDYFKGKVHSYESKKSDIIAVGVSEGNFVPFTENVNITSLGLATFCADAGLDLTENTDVAAYKATVNGNKLELERVYTVTRGEGVLLRSLNGSTIENVVNSEYVKDANEDNAFVGTLKDIVVAQTEGDNTNYVLGQKNGVTGFYIANNTKLSAGKAYLPVATSAAVKGFSISFSDDDATGIVEVATEESMDREGFYNLRGERVDRPENGIYIKGGKKVYFINK